MQSQSQSQSQQVNLWMLTNQFYCLFEEVKDRIPDTILKGKNKAGALDLTLTFTVKLHESTEWKVKTQCGIGKRIGKYINEVK